MMLKTMTTAVMLALLTSASVLAAPRSQAPARSRPAPAPVTAPAASAPVSYSGGIDPRRLGFEFGMNINTYSASIGSLNANANLNVSSGTDFFVGMFGDFLFADHFYFEPGLRYNSKRFESVSTFGRTDSVNHYVEVPLYLRGRFPMEGSVVAPYFTFGPNLGFKVGDGATLGGVAPTVNTGAFSDMDFAMDMGLGAEFDLGSADLIIGARYSLGLSNVLDTAGSNWRSRGFHVLGGMTFPF